MADLLQRGQEWLEAQRKAHLSHTVTYRRGALSVEVAATAGATRFESEDGYGLVVEQETRDFLIASDDLVLDGRKTLPERGDRIVERRGGDELVYEVMDLGPERHYRFSDPDGRTLRIHTKLVGS